MKNLKNKLIACGLAAITAFSVSVSFKKFSPIKAHAAETFLSEVALVYEDSAEDAQKAIAGTDWKLFNKDLNFNNDNTVFDNGVYLIYKTSTNVEDAITDLRVMDMYGGYSTSNYKQQLEKSRSQYMQAVADLRVAAEEFKTLYNAGDDMAKLAYRQMNYYRDEKTAGGTETNMLMGDFFLNMPTDEKIVQVFMEGNGIIVANLVSLLAVGISGASGETLATRIAEQYAIKDTLGSKEYHEAATDLATAFDSIKTKLIRYDALKEEYNLDDEEMSEEEYSFVIEYATIAKLMTTIQYGDQNLAEFIKGSWMTQDLYPIAAAFTPGQKALVAMGQLETVLKYNSPSKPIAELEETLDKMEAEMKDENAGYLPTYDVYEGVDREIFKGDFAMTTAAERQQALTGETWDVSDARTRTGGARIAYIVAASIDAAMMGIFALGFTFSAIYIHTESMFAFTVCNALGKVFGATVAPYLIGSIALTFIILGTYGITTWYNYYNPDYLEVPTTLIDVKETDLGDKYVKYTAAKVFNGEEGQEVADFNAYEGREWNALYYTKDANAGNCLTPNFVYRENNSTVSKRHQGVSMFGESNAYNLNNHVYNASAPGIYLSVRYSTTKKAAADMPTVVGTMVGGAYYLVTAILGAGVGAGGVALFQVLKNKKKEETIEETPTTGE